jgi:hypothetical protein
VEATTRAILLPDAYEPTPQRLLHNDKLNQIPSDVDSELINTYSRVSRFSRVCARRQSNACNIYLPSSFRKQSSFRLKTCEYPLFVQDAYYTYRLVRHMRVSGPVSISSLTSPFLLRSAVTQSKQDPPGRALRKGTWWSFDCCARLDTETNPSSETIASGYERHSPAVRRWLPKPGTALRELGSADDGSQRTSRRHPMKAYLR